MQGAGFELTIYGAYRVPSNSFTSEDDAIYGDAGGATPMDTNGGANGENEEETHESDGGEEEEEDSEDVSHPAQPDVPPNNQFRRTSSSLWSIPRCHWTYDSRGRDPLVLPTRPNPHRNHSHVCWV